MTETKEIIVKEFFKSKNTLSVAPEARWLN